MKNDKEEERNETRIEKFVNDIETRKYRKINNNGNNFWLMTTFLKNMNISQKKWEINDQKNEHKNGNKKMSKKMNKKINKNNIV